MVLEFASGLNIKNRIYNVHEYKKVFVGDEAVTWISEKYQLSRDKAVEWGQKLLDRG